MTVKLTVALFSGDTKQIKGKFALDLFCFRS